MSGELHKWLHILVCTVMVLWRTQSSLVDITYVERGSENGGVCLDGSLPAYYLAEGFGDGVNNWLVHIEGGSWCNNESTCLARKYTRLGSSNQMDKKIIFSGILSNQKKFNPDFYNWNKVKVGYCDGSSFTGDIEKVDNDTGIYYRGKRVFDAVINDLLDRGMWEADNAILSGCSAGGLTSILHCDYFSTLLSNINVKCFADAGFFLNAEDISHAPHIQDFFEQVVTTHGSEKSLPHSCTSKMSPGLCFFPQNVVAYIAKPLFIVNAAYDSWQIKNILAPGVADPHGLWHKCKTAITKCSPVQIQIMQEYRLQFIETVKNAVESSPSDGYFINSCFAHCQTETQNTWLQKDSPMLNKTTIAQAVGDWYNNRNLFRNIDCPYPCDKTCRNRVFD